VFAARLQITINVEGDVTATVAIDLPGSTSRGSLPIVTSTKATSLVGTVRFHKPELRNANTTFAFLWTQTSGPVRPPPLRKSG